MKTEISLSREEVQDILEGYVNELISSGRHLSVKNMTVVNLHDDEGFCTLEIETALAPTELPTEFTNLYEPPPAPPVLVPADGASDDNAAAVSVRDDDDIPF